MKGTLTDIVEEFQNRTSKAGKPYSAAKVNILLDNGEIASNVLCFSEPVVGASLDLEKNESGYWNIVSKKQAAEDAKHDEIMKALRALYNEIKATQRLLGTQVVTTTTLPENTIVGPSTQATEPKGLEQRVRENFITKPDQVVPMDGDDFDPSSIPF